MNERKRQFHVRRGRRNRHGMLAWHNMDRYRRAEMVGYAFNEALRRMIDAMCLR